MKSIFVDVYSLEEQNVLDKYADSTVGEFLSNYNKSNFVIGDDKDIFVSKIDDEIRIYDTAIMGEQIGNLKIFSIDENPNAEKIEQDDIMKRKLRLAAKKYDDDVLFKYKINGDELVLYRKGWDRPKKYNIKVNIK